MDIATKSDPDDATDETNSLRSQQWALLARLLSKTPDSSTLDALAQLRGDDSALGQSYKALALAACASDPEQVEREFFELFVGVGRGELLPYASFYLTGFLNERPLADLRRDLASLGVERAKDRHEPEDHIASLSEVMAGLADGSIDASPLDFEAPGDAGFFARHLQPWASQFFDDLATAPSAKFFRAVAEVGRTFLDIEIRAFELARAQTGQSRVNS